MRDLSAGPSLLSVNTATVRKQAGLLEIIEACARHGIAAISPWRDQVAAVGLERAARAIKDAGLKLSGYCRGGLFPATGEHVMAARDDNRRAVDEAAALGAPCLILVAGGLPQFARPGSTPSKDLVGARKMIEDGIAELLAYARQARLPLALEPLHPMYAADRAAVNTLAQALDIADRLDPGGTRARRGGRRLSHLVGPRSVRRHRPRRPRPSAARLSRLRLAGADQGHAERPRHDGRRRDRPAAHPAARWRMPATRASSRPRSSPTTGGPSRWTACSPPASSAIAASSDRRLTRRRCGSRRGRRCGRA